MPTTKSSPTSPRRARRAAPQPGAAAPSPLQANKLGALWSTLDRAMASARDDYSPSAAALLIWLSHWQPSGVMQLARVVGLSQPACSRAVDTLAAAGLIEKTPSGGKEVHLALSRSGAREARRLQQQRLAACSGLLAALSAGERESLDRLIDRLTASAVTCRDDAKLLCRFCDHAVCDGPLCPIGRRATAIENGQAVAAAPSPASRSRRR